MSERGTILSNVSLALRVTQRRDAEEERVTKRRVDRDEMVTQDSDVVTGRRGDDMIGDKVTVTARSRWIRIKSGMTNYGKTVILAPSQDPF